MSGLDWLIARPIAHRGLHEAAAGVIENTASAFTAAVAGGYGIECDLQISADGEAMVHHDDALGRLTEGSGRLADMKAAEIKRVRFKRGGDRIFTLGELCDLVGGRATLLLELKSRFDGDLRLPKRAVEVLAGYRGPAALMSFDPAAVAAVRYLGRSLIRGIVAQRHYDHPEWSKMSASEKRRLAFLCHAPQTRPHFVAYSVKDLPSPAPWIVRNIFRRPLLTWTVRDESDRQTARAHADQMIFEGFRPPAARIKNS
jgi:glycerophosphoryl diester phosphodiesterase